MKKCFVYIFIFTFAAITAVSQQNDTTNLSVTRSFFEAYEAGDFDKMSTFWHDSIILMDPIIAELYGYDAKHVGRQVVLDLWKGAFAKKPNYINIDIHKQFTSKNYVVNDLILEISTTKDNQAVVTTMRMFSVFKFEDGKIIEHIDFPDYFAWERQSNSAKGDHKISKKEKSNVDVALNYMAAYAASDVQAMSAFYTSGVVFKDLTAKDFFGSSNFEQTGKANVAEFWKAVLVDTQAKYLSVNVNSTFYSGSYVMLNTTFSMVLPPTWTGGKENVLVSFPIQTVLQIIDGRVAQHWDFADYDSYRSQISIQTTP